jgi:cell division protein ZapA
VTTVKRSVTVEVAGQKYSLRTDADEAYVRSLARFVTEKIGEAKTSSRTVATQSLAILAALHIADDLFQARRKSDGLKKRVREKSQLILEFLEREAKL